MEKEDALGRIYRAITRLSAMVICAVIVIFPLYCGGLKETPNMAEGRELFQSIDFFKEVFGVDNVVAICPSAKSFEHIEGKVNEIKKLSGVYAVISYETVRDAVAFCEELCGVLLKYGYPIYEIREHKYTYNMFERKNADGTFLYPIVIVLDENSGDESTKLAMQKIEESFGDFMDFSEALRQIFSFKPKESFEIFKHMSIFAFPIKKDFSAYSCLTKELEKNGACEHLSPLDLLPLQGDDLEAVLDKLCPVLPPEVASLFSKKDGTWYTLCIAYSEYALSVSPDDDVVCLSFAEVRSVVNGWFLYIFHSISVISTLILLQGVKTKIGRR